MSKRGCVGTDGEDAMLKFEAVRTIFSFDTYLLSIHEPAFPIDIFDAVACYKATYTIGQAIHDTLLPCLHFSPVKRDGCGGDAHGSKLFLVCLLIAFCRC